MPGLRSSTMAMMCRTRLICRFPARESRWRTWSPEEASMGAVPVQDAKWALFGEPGDVPDLDQQPGRPGGADAGHVGLATCPVANTRARADIFGGTSTTSCPWARSRRATCRPIPLQPSIAQTRWGHARTYSTSAVNPSGSVANLPPPKIVSSPAITSIVTDRLCGSIPMTTRPECTMSSSAARTGVVVEQGGHRYFELSKPLLSLSPPRRHPGCAGHERATRQVVGSRRSERQPGRLDRASPGTRPGSMEQVAADMACG